jgi:hypothetical protein
LYLCTCTQVQKRLPKPNQNPPKELTGKEKVYKDWVKDVKGLQANLQKDMHLFLSWKIRGATLVSDKQSGVTKELYDAISNGFLQVQSQVQSISEVLVKVLDKTFDTFNPKDFTKNVEAAKDVQKALADLKAKGLRIIGK